MGYKRSSKKSGRWLSATALICSLAGSAAYAQDSAPAIANLPGASQQPGSDGLQEIVVTAQKREESLQKVPMSIQALSTERLQQMHVEEFADYAKLLPSVAYQQTEPGRANVYMRGIASDNYESQNGVRPTVGIYLDEAPITTIGGAVDIHLYDISRVEALAGPQGTLYGASSESGTLRIITNKPDLGKFSAAYDLQGNSVAHGAQGYSGEGYVNLPLSDRAALRVVGYAEHDPGYIDNVFGTRSFSNGVTANNSAYVKKNYNDVDTYGGRAALKYEISDDWTVTPSIIGQYEKSHGSFGYEPAVGDLEVQHFTKELQKDTWYQAALTVQGKIRDFDVTYSGSHMDRHANDLQDYADYAYYYDQLYGYASYAHDNAGNPVNPVQSFDARYHYKTDSQELRIASPADKRFRVIAGAFYENQTALIFQHFVLPGLTSQYTVTGFPDTIYLTNVHRVDRDYALFGEASLDLTSNLTLTGGIRGYKTRNSLNGFFGYNANFSSSTGEAVCFGPATTPGGPCTNLNKTERSSGETHKLNLTWRFDHDKLIYATYSTGFRPGGVNRKGGFDYKPDDLTNYELGWKTSWDNNRLRWNGAVYREDWNKFQFSFLGPNSITIIANAAQARIYGVESDVSFRVDRHLSIVGAGAYTHAVLTKPYCGSLLANGDPDTSCANPQAPKGARLPVTPRFKGNVTARYEAPIGSLTGHVQGSVSYQTFSWSDLRTAYQQELGKQQPYAQVDFTIGVQRDNWSIDFSVLNAFDKLGQVYRYSECSVCTPLTYIRPIRPRTLGIRFGQKF